jgi:hypothetical protein
MSTYDNQSESGDGAADPEATQDIPPEELPQPPQPGQPGQPGQDPSLLKFPANRQTIRSRPRRSRRSLSHQRSLISQSRTPAFRQAAELVQNALGLT